MSARPLVLSLAVLAALSTVLSAAGRSTAGPEPSPYEVTVLPTLGGQRNRAQDINDAGQVCGWAHKPNGDVSACLWTDGQPVDLGNLGGTNSIAYSINNDGWVCGDSATAGGGRQAFVWVPTAPNATTGNMIPLPPLAAGKDSFASDINANGLICGWARNDNGFRRPVVWEPQLGPGRIVAGDQGFTLFPLPPPDGNIGDSTAWALNDQGLIGGIKTGSSFGLLRWEKVNGTWVLTQAAPPPDAEQASVSAVTETGEVVVNGASSKGASTVSVPWRFGNNTYTTYVRLNAQDVVNDERGGVAVGSSRPGDGGPSVGTKITPGAKTPEVLNGGPELTVRDATAINDSGIIAVNGINTDGLSLGGIVGPPRGGGHELTKRAYRGNLELEAHETHAVPNECVKYEIVATNRGPDVLANVALDDSIEAFIDQQTNLKVLKVRTEPPTNWSRESDPKKTLVRAEWPSWGPGQSIKLIVICKTLEARVDSYGNWATLRIGGSAAGSKNFTIRNATVRNANKEVETEVQAGVDTEATIKISNILGGRRSSELERSRSKPKEGWLPGPLYLIFDDLKNATLARAGGETTRLAPLKSPYIKLKQKSLPAGKAIKVKVKFTPDKDGGPITFTPRFAIGPDTP